MDGCGGPLLSGDIAWVTRGDSMSPEAEDARRQNVHHHQIKFRVNDLEYEFLTALSEAAGEAADEPAGGTATYTVGADSTSSDT